VNGAGVCEFREAERVKAHRLCRALAPVLLSFDNPHYVLKKKNYNMEFWEKESNFFYMRNGCSFLPNKVFVPLTEVAGVSHAG